MTPPLNRNLNTQTRYSAAEPWHSMQTRPGDPPFSLSENPLLRPIEYQALLLLRSSEAPTPSEVCTLFSLIPTSHLRRSSKDGSRYVGVGANPRNSEALFTFSRDMPFFTLVITKMIAYLVPDFRYTSCVLFKGCKSRPHRDTNNGGDKSLVMQLSPPIPGARLWLLLLLLLLLLSLSLSLSMWLLLLLWLLLMWLLLLLPPRITEGSVAVLTRPGALTLLARNRLPS